MAASEQPKRRTCTICGAEHKVGEACPECGWDQEKEEKMAKAERERKRLREAPEEPRRRRSLFEYGS